MLGFFIKHKKVRGVITIFLTLIYLATYLMIGVFVDGGRVKMAETAIEDVQQIATENVMSQYHRGLYEYYGLFGVSNYETDQIAKDVQAQIEESIGLKIPTSKVKSFMEDVMLSGDASKRFDPYGIKIATTSVSYIDLSNEEALRAQIRDEMRYTAPLILGANFFSCINQLISLGDATQAVSEVADTIESTSGAIEEKRNEYINSIDNVAVSFRTFVEKTYKTNGLWGEITVDQVIKDFQNITLDSVTEFFENIGKTVVDALADLGKNIFSLFGSKKQQNEQNEQIEQVNDKEEAKKEIESNFKIATDMHRGAAGGFLDIVNKSVGQLSRYYDRFDSSSWPYGDEIDERHWTDENGEDHVEYYYGSESREKHRGDIAERADELADTYKSNMDYLKKYAENTNSSIDASIDKANAALDAIGKAETIFKTGAEKSKTNKSKKIYLSNMEQYLRVWSDITSQKNVLLTMKASIESLIGILDKAQRDVEVVANEIKSEGVYQGFKPSHKLSTKRDNDKTRFHTIMVELDIKTDVIKTFQDTAESESVQGSIFRLLNAIISEKDKEESGIVEEKSNVLFGNIKGHEKSNNVLYDPYKAAEEKDRESAVFEMKKLKEKNIVQTVKEIMSKAGEIIAGLPKEIFDNIYDETYILSHCRDYVHTHRYVENKYQNLSQEELESQNIDTVLNTKFIKDQSDTNYLSDAQFRDMQVTPAEIEYIIFGIKEHKPVKNNVTMMYANIFILRLALNYIAALSSPRSFKDISELAAGATVFAPIVYVAAPLIYALPQSIKETKEIMYDCKEVSIWNGSPDLGLYSAIEGIGKEVAKEAFEKVKKKAEDVAKNAANNVDAIATLASIEAHRPLPTDIENARSYVFQNLNLLGINNDSVTKDEYDDKAIKAGYSDYLLIFLFLGGIGPLKKTQITRLQDVIETNMQRVDDKFELRTTYSQVGVETKSTIKYIFMTQSFMKRTFSNAKKYNEYPIRVRTSFAY